MGRASKERKIRARARRQTRAVLGPTGELTIIIATSPTGGSDGKPTLEGDLRLVRSALLYADQVELVSYGALMVAATVGALEGGAQLLTQVMSEMSDEVLATLGAGDPRKARVGLEAVMAYQRLTRAERRVMGTHGKFLEETIRGIESASGSLEAAAQERLSRFGGEELAEASEAGALTILADAFDLSSSTDDQVAQYSDTLRQLLEDPSAHLLLDERMSELAHSMRQDGRVDAHQATLRHLLASSTGSGLAARLPAFPDATMRSVLSAREELRDPLVKYRRAVATLSGKLHGDALDYEGLQAEIDDLWHDEVEPALMDLRRGLSGARIAREAVLNTVKDIKAIALATAGPFLAMGVTGQSLIAAASGLTPIALPAAAGAAQAYTKAKDAAQEKDLYYLLDLDRRL